MAACPDAPLRLALVQFEATGGDVAANLQRSLDLVRRAAAGGARLVAFPELSLTGYELGLLERDAEGWFRPEDSRLSPLRRECEALGVSSSSARTARFFAGPSSTCITRSPSCSAAGRPIPRILTLPADRHPTCITHPLDYREGFMSEVVHERIVRLVDAEGTVYDRAFVYAELRDDRRWRAFIEYLSSDEQDAVRTGTETTQSSLEDMADWAEHLEPVYLEGAFRRALRRDRPEQELTEPASVAATSVPISIETDDPELPMRLMGTNTLVPGLRREVVPGVVLGYAGSASEGVQETGTYDFAVEIESEAAAGLLADVLFGELEATHGAITVDGAQVRPRRRAIKEALLGIPVR